jgi:beta-mannosidase
MEWSVNQIRKATYEDFESNIRTNGFEVWHGTQEKYQIFDSIGGRFNSEFGMEAFPHMSTIEYFVENDQEKHPQSQVMDFHNKADGHERRLATYLVENLRMSTDLEVCCLPRST